MVTGARYAREKYGNKPSSSGKNECIIEKVYSKKGGSKKYRRYLEYGTAVKPVTELRTVKTFFELVRLPVPDPEICGIINAVWNVHVLPNNVRVFAFQFYNNSLPTAARLAARYQADPAVLVDELCTFCVKAGLPAQARERFFHLFFDCQGIASCLNRYLAKYGEGNWNLEEKKKFFFTGSETGDCTAETMLIVMHNIIFCYGLWLCKLGKKIPSFTTVENNMLTIFDTALLLSNFWTEIASTGTSSICRLWRNRCGRG
jgi:hypothetical protein